MGARDNNGASPDAIDTRTLDLIGEFDATKWAAEFHRLNRASDETVMHAWFASAIMAGYDHRSRELLGLVQQLDVALNGAVGAGAHPTLSDLVAQVERQRCVQVFNLPDGMRINFRSPDGRRATLNVSAMLDRELLSVAHAGIVPTMRDAIAAYPVAGVVPVPAVDADECPRVGECETSPTDDIGRCSTCGGWA